MNYMKEVWLITLLVCSAFSIQASPITFDKVYWTNNSSDYVRSINLDGTDPEVLVNTGNVFPQGIAVDLYNGKIYWTDPGTDSIKSSNLDGSNVEIVISNLPAPRGLVIDNNAAKIYWVQSDISTDNIQRSNLDGTNIEVVLTMSNQGIQSVPLGLAFDEINQKLYWVDIARQWIQRSNTDGTNVETLLDGLPGLYGIAVDTIHEHIYFTNNVYDKIQRVGLDGTGLVDIITSGLEIPKGIAVDPIGGRIYWTDAISDKLQSANLDGSSIEDLFVEPDGTTGGPNLITLGPSSPISRVPEPPTFVLLLLGFLLARRNQRYLIFSTRLIRSFSQNIIG